MNNGSTSLVLCVKNFSEAIVDLGRKETFWLVNDLVQPISFIICLREAALLNSTKSRFRNHFWNEVYNYWYLCSNNKNLIFLWNLTFFENSYNLRNLRPPDIYCVQVAKISFGPICTVGKIISLVFWNVLFPKNALQNKLRW